MKPSSGANSLHTHTHFLRKCCKYLRQESGAESVRKKINIQSGALECKGTSNCEELRVNIHIFHTNAPMPTPRL